MHRTIKHFSFRILRNLVSIHYPNQKQNCSPKNFSDCSREYHLCAWEGGTLDQITAVLISKLDFQLSFRVSSSWFFEYHKVQDIILVRRVSLVERSPLRRIIVLCLLSYFLGIFPNISHFIIWADWTYNFNLLIQFFRESQFSLPLVLSDLYSIPAGVFPW